MSVESQLYEIRLKTDQFKTALDNVESKLNGFESKLGGVGKTAAGVFGGGLLLSAFSKLTDVIAGTGMEVIKLGADFEQTQVSFKTMLGSAELANKSLKELEEFAAKTPFRFSEVVEGSKQLLAYGFEADSLTKNLTVLGDVASGLSIPMGDLIYLYGTLKSQGKVMTKDLMQFAMRGIPIYDELSKVLGVTKQELGEIVTDGKVRFEDVEQAFKNMTAIGSKFGGLMDAQSKTLAGRWSTFQDKLEQIGRELGMKLLPYLGRALDGISSMLDYVMNINFNGIIDAFKDLWTSVKPVFDLFGDLFGFIGQFITLNDIIKNIALSFRIATFPVRFLIESFKELGVIAKGAGELIISSFKAIGQAKNLDFKGALDTLKGGGIDFAKSFGEAGQMQKAFFTNEAKKIYEIFNPKKLGGAVDATANAMGLNKGGSFGSSGSGSSASGIGVEKVASSTRNININIDNLVKEINFNKAQNFRESESELVDRVRRALLTMVNDVNIVAQ